MTKGGMTVGLVATLRSGAWLDRRRLGAYPLLFLALYGAIGLAWALGGEGFVDPRGIPLGGDFLGAEDAFGHAANVPGFAARVASGRARVAGRLGRFDELARHLIAATKAT